ncbi:Glutathione transport system permease protein GsiD [Paenibacillus konkukensis]|uniref:Glutathione transport system permease protein GsiD n=1 Tax=Paenibacillus konkukensis TaxID=2020716 RepID=A0ABY4RUX1_9BACL|nr:ABC transporter permease [Paenibacillus konkukensis]UQZ85847.1 Glutathione transport system permease protein GsiD [Paenibacillus konkukensis]
MKPNFGQDKPSVHASSPQGESTPLPSVSRRSAGSLLTVPNVIALSILAVIVLGSLLAPLIAPYDPNRVNMAERLAPLTSEHLLGTDTLGRDVFSRILYGGRVSILLALAVTAATMLIGLVVGTAAGYFGGWIDDTIQAVIHIFQGLPGLSLMIAIAGTLGPGVQSIFIALILTSWADFSRVVRGEAMKLREEAYVEGIRVLGAGHAYILARHIVPNMLGPLTVLFTVRIGRVILSIASLSFLGLGLQPPTPDWGVMVNDARPYFRSYFHLILAPGLCIAAVSFSINWLGDGLRDWLDSKNSNEQSLL